MSVADQQSPVQEYEYDQDIIKPTSKGKFDGVLNKRARAGWKVVNVAPSGEHFLVTYARYLSVRKTRAYTTTVSSGPRELDDELGRMIGQGYTMIHFSSLLSPLTANGGLSHELVYTCVWRRSA